MGTKEVSGSGEELAFHERIIARKIQNFAKGGTRTMTTTNFNDPAYLNFPAVTGGCQPLDKTDNSFAGDPPSSNANGHESSQFRDDYDGDQSLEKIPHILCVDDEQDILSVAKLSLETVGGYKVTTCSSGPEAVERIKDINPDLILLDVMMPHMGGPETLQALRTVTEAAITPIVFMTARVQPKEVEEYLQLGAAAVVHKPFDPMQLASQIGEILDRSKSH